MKNNFAITPLAVGAILTLFVAVSNLFASEETISGTVRVESSAEPALNFSMPLSQVEAIYQLMPESVSSYCEQEYLAVRKKMLKSSRFTHEGVKVEWHGRETSMDITFTVQGYKLTVSNVSLYTLDGIFHIGYEG